MLASGVRCVSYKQSALAATNAISTHTLNSNRQPATVSFSLLQPNATTTSIQVTSLSHSLCLSIYLSIFLTQRSRMSGALLHNVIPRTLQLRSRLCAVAVVVVVV